jgi:hypothetical protein
LAALGIFDGHHYITFSDTLCKVHLDSGHPGLGSLTDLLLHTKQVSILLCLPFQLVDLGVSLVKLGLKVSHALIRIYVKQYGMWYEHIDTDEVEREKKHFGSLSRAASALSLSCWASCLARASQHLTSSSSDELVWR